MIHHVSVGSSDLERSRIFYQAVIPLLGYRLVSEDEQSLDYGSGVFAFSVERPLDGEPATGGNGTHIAFEARNRAAVDAFHREGLAHGGRDAGAPGLRPEYDANYYGAFLFDPDGNKVEAVTYSAT
ncbi:VOC family protein [Sphingomonas sp. BT-65]|uniref:VOC family protein n=1 Tax=Sphingomonas sp. BT-65 TaxID=2989821 RepID=UPI00223551B4|nr:VOC family protein [Sphingomonas sp. BT-65]MCW4461837.1 VOC family protein [Sphingomonas sp. BT-65]